jgi:hypothetical protein
MLVYANNLGFQGAGAKDAIFKAIGAWLKEQLGFGLHPDQVKRDGEYNGNRGDKRSWLRIHATNEEEPELYAWILKNPDDTVYGRLWITELGLRTSQSSLEFSCVLKTEELSTLIEAPVMASQPRVIGYVAKNIHQAVDAEFAHSPSVFDGTIVGLNRESYGDLLDEIERIKRESPIVLVSPTWDGEYLLNAVHLRQKLVGLAQVLQVSPDFNSYEMEEVIGRGLSAWSGAVNIIYPPTPLGFVRHRLFFADEIAGWGDTQQHRISKILAWVTNGTNTLRLRKHIRPEGVMQLALRRRLQRVHDSSDKMDASQLRDEMGKASQLALEQDEWISTLEAENGGLESRLSDAHATLADEREKVKKLNFTVQTLRDQFENSGTGQSSSLDADALLSLACSPDPPTPLQCIEVIEDVFREGCIILDSAKDSARDMIHFIYGRRLLDMLRRLVTDYRSKLLDGGDNEARKVFGKSEFAAKESETVMANKTMRRQRTFEYRGEQLEMFRHLKIGTDENIAKTIRVHFHWDAEREKVVIAYCGEHFPVSSC